MHMRTHLVAAILPWALACSWGVQLARADIYTWTDAKGTVNVSNVAPPEGTRITRVVQESPPEVIEARAAADDHTLDRVEREIGISGDVRGVDGRVDERGVLGAVLEEARVGLVDRVYARIDAHLDGVALRGDLVSGAGRHGRGV